VLGLLLLAGIPGLRLLSHLLETPLDVVAIGHEELELKALEVRRRVGAVREPVQDGEKILQGFRDVANPVAEHVGPIPYAALNSAFDALVPRGLQHYWKAAFIDDLTPEAIRTHMEHGPGVPAVNSTVHLYPINGACHDVAPDATAFGHRDATYAAVIAGMWPDPADNEANTAWVRGYEAAISPHSQGGMYVNFASADDQPKVAANYGVNYARLQEVKGRYDPGNLFHLNQNIRPG